MKKMIDEKALEKVIGGLGSSAERRQLPCVCGAYETYSTADIYEDGDGYWVTECKVCGEILDWGE